MSGSFSLMCKSLVPMGYNYTEKVQGAELASAGFLWSSASLCFSNNAAAL